MLKEATSEGLAGKVLAYNLRRGDREEERSVGVYGPVRDGGVDFYLVSLVRPVDPESLYEDGEPKPFSITKVSDDGKILTIEQALSRQALIALIEVANAKLAELPE